MFDQKWRKRYEKTERDMDGWHPTDGALVYVSEQESEGTERIAFGTSGLEEVTE